MWCESPSRSHAGTRSSLILPVSLPRLLSLRGDVSLDAGQLINCRKIEVLEAVLWLRGACCLIQCSVLSRIAYLRDLAGCLLCWLLGLAGDLAFLSAECLCCWGEGGLWCPGEGSWAPVLTALCFSQDCMPPREQHPVVPGYLRATGRNARNVAIAFWMVLVRLFWGEEDDGEGPSAKGWPGFSSSDFCANERLPSFLLLMAVSLQVWSQNPHGVGGGLSKKWLTAELALFLWEQSCETNAGQPWGGGLCANSAPWVVCTWQHMKDNPPLKKPLKSFCHGEIYEYYIWIFAMKPSGCI